jgi:hypothetical protein
MLRVADLHTEYIGKIAKLHPMAAELESQYEELFKIGNTASVEYLLFFQNEHICKMAFMFIDSKPIHRHNMTWFCLKEITTTRHKVCGNWHWFTLDQLIICS